MHALRDGLQQPPPNKSKTADTQTPLQTRKLVAFKIFKAWYPPCLGDMIYEITFSTNEIIEFVSSYLLPPGPLGEGW